MKMDCSTYLFKLQSYNKIAFVTSSCTTNCLRYSSSIYLTECRIFCFFFFKSRVNVEKQSVELPSPPMITINSNMTEMESDTDTMSPPKLRPSAHVGLPRGDMCYLSPFSLVGRCDRTISESNLSSSGYSSMASPAPSLCGSGNPLFVNDMEDGPPNGKFHKMLTLRRSSSQGKPCDGDGPGTSNANSSGSGANKQLSDSETMSDDILLESNDEGISTDHIDEKFSRTKVDEMFIDVAEHSRSERNDHVSESSQKSQLQLPTIVVQGDGVSSPVSSRSESPIR